MLKGLAKVKSDCGGLRTCGPETGGNLRMDNGG